MLRFKPLETVYKGQPSKIWKHFESKLDRNNLFANMTITRMENNF